MAFTSHGHHIPGTIKGDGNPPKDRCGGPSACQRCASEVASAVINSRVVGERGNMQDRFIRLVRNHVERTYRLDNGGKAPEPFDVYVVWFSKTLQNAKALLGTTLPDKMYYELTHDGDKRVIYFDAYTKTANIVFLDDQQ